MQFEIKHRWTGSVLFSLECASLKLCVEAAVGQKVSLRDADLRGVDLRDVDLRGAHLGGADLRGVDLSGAYLRGVDLRGAVGDFATEEESEAMLRKIAEIVVADEARLAMGGWHGSGWDPTHTPEEEHSCGTTHCLAGWAQALCPVPLIRRMEPSRAGAMLIPTAAHLFYGSTAEVLEFLRSKLEAK